MKTYWNDNEEGALQGLPWLAQLVYLRGIKPFMDYSCGVVGVKRGISYRSIAETLYVEQIAGRKVINNPLPTESAIRNGVQILISNGLLKSIKHERKLIFYLPFADTDQSAQNYYNRAATEQQQVHYDSQKSTEFNDLTHSSNRAATEQKTAYYNTPPNTYNLKSKAPRQNTHVSSNEGYEEIKEPRHNEDPVLCVTPLEADTNIAEHREQTPVPISTAVTVIETPIPNFDTCSPKRPMWRPDDDRVTRVFRHWQTTMCKPNTILSKERGVAILSRLNEGYTDAQLMLAITGCAGSDWHMGRDNNGRENNDIELICRDAIHVDKFIQKTRGNMSKAQKWADYASRDSAIKGEFTVDEGNCHGR